MEEFNVIKRPVYVEVPVRVEYEFTWLPVEAGDSVVGNMGCQT
ncbi:hypothetical protein [Mucilaginibacter koreensis]